MNREIALKILEINNNNNLSYDEKISQLEDVAGSDFETHTTITDMPYSVRNCYILEALKFLNNFETRKWAPSNLDIKVKQNETPVEFKILTQKGKYKRYSLYNLDQLCIDKEQIVSDNLKLQTATANIDTDNSLVVNSTKANLKNYLLLSINNLLNEHNQGYIAERYKRNIDIFIMRYGLNDNKVKTLEEIGERYNISRERVRQLIAKIIKFTKIKCTKAKNRNLKNMFLTLYNRLQTVKNDLLQNSKDNQIDKQFADALLEKEFENNDLIYLDLINKLCNTEFTVKKTEKTVSDTAKYDNLTIKKAILACIKEFSGKYGKSGIAKILKGSRGIKDNLHNKETLKSSYYGMFNQLTLSYITSEIDELLKDELITTSKVSFGRPILNINPEFSNKIDSLIEDLPIKNEENDKDDNNLSRILYLIKQNKNVFITGHAGTGKSYILSKLKERIPKLVITSTTGIAAVNVKGQTIHSWAGIGICNRPVTQVVERIMSKSSLRNQIQKCEILAIDEISMLDIKTFEYVDAVLKQVRDCSAPFGGIQVIFIGDFFQLPPVEQNKETNLKYCFESDLWSELDLHTVLLTRNYRQNEEDFITALSNMRTNSLTNQDINLLKTRECKENNETNTALHIFATNLEADNYNRIKFEEIHSKEYTLYAIDGVYKGEKLINEPTNQREENILNRIDVVCSAEKSISLKIGIRVMLLINYDFEKGLINGSCGEVQEINEDYVLVKFDNGQLAKITKHDFEFYNNEKLIAVRRQFPLRLAYGITIHKSQGMSLDKLVVDCSRIFEKGQAYVALSRIKTLNGLYLCNFNPSKVMVDDTVVNFYNNLKIFDEEIEIESKNEKESKPTVKEPPTSDNANDNSIEYYTNIIRNIILNNNRWIEIFEIADILGVNRHKKLVECTSNSTIAHLINRFLKKEGFVTQRINYSLNGYSIVVAPPGFRHNSIPDEILTIPYQKRKKPVI